ncbi:MAG: hypothetical protein A2992_01165 [Elusimicrobia bacterium RIFCSPLOWO2_01_FULL_59_12]|nr:MAG: hypothetical protein A2992_01165 [Elusimicrobia bacterium RIFCSPLOWO2_01_FULL_59_12]
MYTLAYDRRVRKDLRLIPKPRRIEILEKAEKLAAEPRSFQVEKLIGIEGYRLRIGDYRVLFTIDDRGKLVTVYRVLHRREAYR